jgi:hypothetical protein
MARRLIESGSDELPLRVALALRLFGLGLVYDLDHARLFVLAPLLVPQKLPFQPSVGMAHAALTSSLEG